MARARSQACGNGLSAKDRRETMNLDGRVVIVTGASGDIGSATVRAFAAARAHVVLAAPLSEIHVLDQLASEAERCGARALIVPTDVTVRGDIDKLVSSTLDAFEAIDVLANVAGIGSSPAVCDDTDDDLRRVVNVGSIAGEAGVMGMYSATKFGLRGLSDTVRREVRSWNIGVTLIEPGFVRSRMNVAMGDRLPSPDIVARAVVRAVSRPRRCVIVPGYYAVPIFITKLFPGLVDRVFGDARIQRRLNRDARAARAERVSP